MDYVTTGISLLGLVVSVLAYRISSRKDRREAERDRKTAEIEAMARLTAARGRMTEVLSEFYDARNMIQEVRWFFQQVQAAPHPEDIGKKIEKGLSSLGLLTGLTRLRIDEVRAFDPKDLAAEADRRSRLDELYSESQEVKKEVEGWLALEKKVDPKEGDGKRE